MGARQVVILTPSKSLYPIQLLSSQQPVSVSPLAATLVNLLARAKIYLTHHTDSCKILALWQLNLRLSNKQLSISRTRTIASTILWRVAGRTALCVRLVAPKKSA